MLGTGITLSAPLTAAHAQGAATRGLGTGIDFTPALTAAQPANAALSTPGSGLALTSAADAARTPPARRSAARFRPTSAARPTARSSPGTCKEVRPAPLLRKAFSVAPVSEHGAVVSARVYAAGLAWNDMSLNGDKTSDRTFLDPGFTSYDKTVLYTTDDVTGLIRQDASAAPRTSSRRSSAPASTTTRRPPATGAGRPPSGARTRR